MFSTPPPTPRLLVHVSPSCRTPACLTGPVLTDPLGLFVVCSPWVSWMAPTSLEILQLRFDEPIDGHFLSRLLVSASRRDLRRRG